MFQVAARLTVPRPITKSRLPNFAGWARNPAFLLRSVMYPQGWIDNATPAETAPRIPHSFQKCLIEAGYSTANTCRA
ncbi:hypothetical protein EOA35_35775 [Mesorhizobium sp. M8A.F.Ca.ET.023.01.1.1]|nr:hypothetical protein EOA35_35775 [Mesorhizobium sp. M8A.F.Ca.ET.023.01.1.1]